MKITFHVSRFISPDEKTGSVLIVSLWALMFLSALAVSIGTRTAACIQLAEHVKVTSAIDRLASAGVERAVAAVKSGNEDVLSGEASEYWSMDYPVEGMGEFSVYHTAYAEDGSVVTNYGVVSESARTNINNHAQLTSLLKSVAGSGADIAESARQYRLAKKTLTKGLSEGKFESIYELLLVDGMTDEVFSGMEPYITVFGRHCYRGISRARLSYDGDSDEEPGAEGQIVFVFDAQKDKIVHWEQ